MLNLLGGISDQVWPPIFIEEDPVMKSTKDQIGISLKSVHYDAILQLKPDLDFFEIHAENYMMAAGPHIDILQEIRKDYDISVHGVGLSLGSAEGIDHAHLKRFKALIDHINPSLVSEHLSWSVNKGQYLNDLLPLPLTSESLQIVSQNIQTVQDYIGRQLLVENPSSYLSYNYSTLKEAEFLNQLALQSQCGLLLDVNNVYVSGHNLDYSVSEFVKSIDMAAVNEIHLAGHAIKDIEGRTLLIDDHGGPICNAVWELYDFCLQQGVSAATLIEWDSNIPDLAVLLAEANKAQSYMNSYSGRAA